MSLFPLLLSLVPSSHAAEAPATTTPIKHLVVLFQENVSFDHYFATYPNALNLPGEPAFRPKLGTPTVNGLSGPLLSANPNAAPPKRLDRAHAATCDQDHGYGAEQKAFDGGLMDKFVESTGATENRCDPKEVMAYFDGNTVTALWNYAQAFAMSDDYFGTTFGPSTPGAINLASGQTHGVEPADLVGADGDTLTVRGTILSDPDPEFDDCSSTPVVRMTGANIGDRMNEKGLRWGWFEGGFRPTGRRADGAAVCGASHNGANGKKKDDYVPHHEPFQYYRSTANPHHAPPASLDEIGGAGPANHQYDLADFWTAAEAGRLPQVSFLKAPAFQDGHAGYSDPVNEQAYLVETINRLGKLADWKDLAIVVTYDDSDGWYDHQMGPIVRHSDVEGVDALTGGACGRPAQGEPPARCGYGPRLPLLIVSPYARTNYVDHAVTDQTSILRLIEKNWGVAPVGGGSYDEDAGSLMGLFDFSRKPAKPLALDPSTGELRARK